MFICIDTVCTICDVSSILSLHICTESRFCLCHWTLGAVRECIVISQYVLSGVLWDSGQNLGFEMYCILVLFHEIIPYLTVFILYNNTVNYDPWIHLSNIHMNARTQVFPAEYYPKHHPVLANLLSSYSTLWCHTNILVVDRGKLTPWLICGEVAEQLAIHNVYLTRFYQNQH